LASEIGAQETKAVAKVSEKASEQEGLLKAEESGRIEFAKNLGKSEGERIKKDAIDLEVQAALKSLRTPF
jgi:hypothetical protein